MRRLKRCVWQRASWKAAVRKAFRKRHVRWLCRLQAMAVIKQNGSGRKDRLLVAARVHPLASLASPPRNAYRHRKPTSETLAVEPAVLIPVFVTMDFEL